MARKVSHRVQQPHAGQTVAAFDAASLPAVAGDLVGIDFSAMTTNKSIGQTLQDAMPVPEDKSPVNIWAVADVRQPESGGGAAVTTSRRSSQAAAALASLQVSDTPDRYFDAFMESLPPALREKLYGANLTSITALINLPVARRAKPRGIFTSDELGMLVDRLTRLGTAFVGSPVSREGVVSEVTGTPRQQRTAHVRSLRRG